MQDVDRFRVAIVGSGPSGFYAAEALLQSMPDVEIDVLERLPAPFGLVRYGVAPDHQKLKEVTRVFTGLACDARMNFVGNVVVGDDIAIEELLDIYDAVIVACGASVDRKMGIPGESLAGCHSAVDFVGWYNGHPEHCHHRFDLRGEVAVIVGQGNVAIDVCRILAKSVAELHKTDIAEHALDTLATSRIKRIVIVGRRGPAQMKFTAKEFRELGTLEGWDVAASVRDLDLDPVSAAEVAHPQAPIGVRNIRFLREFATRERKVDRLIDFRFLRSPLEALGADRITGVVLGKNLLTGEPFRQRAMPTGETETISADVVFRSIGYCGTPLAGLPFDASSGTIPNQLGRATTAVGVIPGIYVTGWIKRGPTGIIGTNRADSIETVASLAADRTPKGHSGKPGRTGLYRLLAERGVRPVSFDEWRVIDAEELHRGQRAGRIRSKIIKTEEMLSIATGGGQTASERAGVQSSQPVLS